MILVAYNAERQHITFVRELADNEVDSHRNFTNVVAEARNRLTLFRMLHRNFLQWRSFIEDLLSPKTKEPDDALEELNRLLLNYLTCAYTICEHFEVSFQQRYRNDRKKRHEFEVFLDSLCNNCWPFAFFLDLRGYVQHRGFGVGHYSRTVGQTVVQVTISADAEQLLSESRDWKKSRLQASHGKIDLVGNLQDFHLRMRQDFGGFVARTFFPELKPAADFYAGLTAEAKTKDFFSRMVFTQEAPKVTRDGSKMKTNLSLIVVPNAVFEELGIQIPTGS